MKSNESKITRPSAIGIRPSPFTREILESLSQEERRTIPSLVVYIVDQYLSSTNGKLLKNIKIVSGDQA